MPNIENNFNNNDFNIISPDGNDITATFADPGDYIRLTVFNAVGNIVKLGNGNDAIFYASEADLELLTPGKVGDTFTVITGPSYSYETITNTYSTSTLIENLFEHYGASVTIEACDSSTSPYVDDPTIFNRLDGTGCILQSACEIWTNELGYINYVDVCTSMDDNQTGAVGGADYNTAVTDETTIDGSVTVIASDEDPTISGNDFIIYRDEADNIYLKPNEILAENLIPEGDYTIQVDFLNQFPLTDDNFIIKQISPSRKEVRLKLLNHDITSESSLIGQLDTRLTDNYNHVLYIGGGVNIPIVNHLFDTSKDGENNQSIILKLYEPLPTNITTLTLVTIEEEVLVTQTEEVFYFSDVPPVSVDGSLNKDSSFDYGFYEANEDFQSYDDLSGSLSSQVMNGIFSGSSYEYPNLNVDYNEFENHTFFGSAVKKLENFKVKIGTIQGYYSDISSSLSGLVSGIAIGGDSTYLKQYRSSLFDKIQLEVDGFTPYERFLYFDGQSESSASAPGVGENYADTLPVQNHTNELTSLTNYDGFNVVYKHSNELMSDPGDVSVTLFGGGKYLAQNKPFFNYSSSIYLSFILKGDETIGHSGTPGLKWTNVNQHGLDGELSIPQKAFGGTNKVQNPSITGSEYRRFIYKTSQSYWAPLEGQYLGSDEFDFTDSGLGSSYEILTGRIKTGSFTISTPGNYQNLATVVTQSGVYFSGSIMPAGELFRVYYTSGSAITSSYMTDVKVTFKDPTDVLPFDILYQISSTNWTTWYDSLYSNAVSFDETNIHSLENNLPTYIQQSSDYDDLKKFLSMNGEHFDLIRNHIDGMGTIYNRNYKKQDSVPSNLLPIILDNMGWDSINPFTGSLSAYFNNSLSSTTSVKDISENTWRKSLNNLIYLYKSKGTKNSIRALLNIYGYPPDVLEINEYGGSNEDQTTGGPIYPIDPHIPTFGSIHNDTDLTTAPGNVSYVSTKQKLYNYIFNSNRVLNFEWWMNEANPDTIEFVYKHRNSTTDQEIFKSSGSGAEALWDLRVQESASLYNFEFRLNNSNTGSLAIASNAVSMSTPYGNIGEGNLLNVMLQRISSSINGSGTQEYRLYTGHQNNQKISTLNFTSMSISGGLDPLTDSNHRANQNWVLSGSRHQLSSSNLYVGQTLSGSLAEVRTWTSALSISRFRLHTLNKLSTVGNNISSHKDDLIYHFKLNENYNSGSVIGSTTITIKDANPKKIKDYSFTKSSDIVTGSVIYGYDIIDTNNIGIQDSGQSSTNDRQIIIDPKISLISNLNPFRSAINNLSDNSIRRAKRTLSHKLDINRSPQNYINNFILDKIQGFNLETLYSNPSGSYDTNYFELDDFRETFFDNYEVSVDINKFIKAQENIYNESLVNSIKKLVPARSNFGDNNTSVGVTIKPTILEKQKYKNKKHSVEVNPNTVIDTIEITKRTGYKSGFSSIGNYEAYKNVDININISETATYEKTKDASLNINNLISKTATYEATKDTTLNINNLISKTSNIETVKEATLNINNLISKTSNIEATKDATLNISNIIVETATHKTTKDATLSLLPNVNSSKQSLYAGSNTYIRDNYTAPFRDLHGEWGRGIDDTHFINHHTTGSNGDNNIAHIDPRYHFYAIGDTEIYSGSISNGSDFSNHRRFFNRQNITEFVHGDTVYESYINGNPGTQTGRAMGKTRYFFTSSNGDIILPSNHIRRHRDPWLNTMYNGTQNTNPGFQQLAHQKYEDLSSASFYRVKVTGGTNQIYVKSNKPRIDGEDDRIIY